MSDRVTPLRRAWRLCHKLAGVYEHEAGRSVTSGARELFAGRAEDMTTARECVADALRLTSSWTEADEGEDY